MTELKPCPFCGSKDLRIPKDFNFMVDRHLNGVGTCVSCLDCGAEGSTIRYVDDVVKAWNIRIDCNQGE